MSKLNLKDLTGPMLSASKNTLNERWPDIREYAKTEMKSIAESIVLIQKLRALGKITEQQASMLLEMKRNTTRIVLLAVDGMTLLMVEETINAAIKAVRDVVNKSLKFALL